MTIQTSVFQTETLLYNFYLLNICFSENFDLSRSKFKQFWNYNNLYTKDNTPIVYGNGLSGYRSLGNLKKLVTTVDISI